MTRGRAFAVIEILVVVVLLAWMIGDYVDYVQCRESGGTRTRCLAE